jgi:hypothetical protein
MSPQDGGSVSGHDVARTEDEQLSCLHPDALHWHTCQAVESLGSDEEIDAHLERVARVNLNIAVLVAHRYWARDVCGDRFGWHPAGTP